MSDVAFTRNVGIDDMALYVPSLYFDIKDLAAVRDLEYAKLNKGLGLTYMAITDAHEDTATMAANAVAELIDKNNLNPNQIGRIYLGTESALDGSKPTATYALEMLRNRYALKYGEDCLRNCDVVDLTFACIGGVDALQNTLDWVNGGTDRIGIVVSSDNAKYELGSTGEYTQGAGAIAVLVKRNPRLMVINDNWGVATMGVHDFYKPLRKASKEQIIEEVLDMVGMKNGSVQHLLDKLYESIKVNGILDTNESTLTLHKETPVFDGQYSNQCYQDRMIEAYEHYRKQIEKSGVERTVLPLVSWKRLVFHLPYAFHAKRVFVALYIKELKRQGLFETFAAEHKIEIPNRADYEEEKTYNKAVSWCNKAISKTPAYKTYVAEKIEKGQRASSLIGNMYTCSIFLSLMSTLDADLAENLDLSGESFGLFAYGSGSKSKVFEGTIQAGWQEIVQKFRLQEKLKARQAISYQHYQDLHRGIAIESVETPQQEFALSKIGVEGVTEGARYYNWIE